MSPRMRDILIICASLAFIVAFFWPWASRRATLDLLVECRHDNDVSKLKSRLWDSGFELVEWKDDGTKKLKASHDGTVFAGPVTCCFVLDGDEVIRGIDYETSEHGSECPSPEEVVYWKAE